MSSELVSFRCNDCDTILTATTNPGRAKCGCGAVYRLSYESPQETSRGKLVAATIALPIAAVVLTAFLTDELPKRGDPRKVEKTRKLMAGIITSGFIGTVGLLMVGG